MLTKAFKNGSLDSEPAFAFTIHFFPLVFHREAYTMSEGVHFIQKEFGSVNATKFVDLVFKNQDAFGTNATYDKTRFEVEDQLAALVESELGIPKQVYLEGVRKRANDLASRTSWKYGCSKGVLGTPTYFANGVFFDGGASLDANGFVEFVRKYVASE